MKIYDFRCPQNHVFEVVYDQEQFAREDQRACPSCKQSAEWAPSINIGAFSAGLWTGQRVEGINNMSGPAGGKGSGMSLREWEREHVLMEPGLDQMADENMKRRQRKETDEIKSGVRHHARNLLKIKSQEGHENYVRDHTPKPTEY